MPKRLTVNGKSYSFPDDTTTEELNEFLSTVESPDPAAPTPSQHPHARTWEWAKGLFNSVDQSMTPETLAKPENFPSTGGMLGGLGGFAIGGPIGAIAGATLGGAAGSGGRDAVYGYTGDKRAPEDFPAGLENAAEEGLWQGGFQALGGAVGPALTKIGSALENRAIPLVRSAMKYNRPDIERRAMIEGRSFDDVANRQSQHIIDNRLTSEGKAKANVETLGKQIDEKVAGFEAANPEAALDFDTRAPKYLSDFLKRIEDNQLLPDQDISAVQSVGPRIMNSPLSRSGSVTAVESRPIEETLQEVLEAARNIGKHADPTGLPPGQFTAPGMVFSQPSPNRVLRDDIQASEMLRRVRGKSFYDPNTSEGTLMGGKVLERAGRDSVKELIPEVAPLLEQQGLSKDAVRALRNYGIREGNADQLRQGALHSLANRNLPAAVLLQLAKAGQLKAGVAAGVRGPQIKRSAESWVADPNVISNALRLMFSQNGQ